MPWKRSAGACAAWSDGRHVAVATDHRRTPGAMIVALTSEVCGARHPGAITTPWTIVPTGARATAPTLGTGYYAESLPDNASAISRTGLLQSPNVACRYNCIDRYHGVSRWLLDQRSSHAADSNTHTGRPSAPAR